MATVHANKILTKFMLLLGGHYHCVKVSSDSETVRGMGLWEFSGVLRELMLRVNMSHIMSRAILVSTDCRCAIYGTLYSSLLDNLTHQLNSVGPDQTPHYAVSHLGSHCLYICPFFRLFIRMTGVKLVLP